MKLTDELSIADCMISDRMEFRRRDAVEVDDYDGIEEGGDRDEEEQLRLDLTMQLGLIKQFS